MVLISTYIYGYKTELLSNGLGHIAILGMIRGGIKKDCFFSEKLRKGGGGVSPNPKFPYQKKLRFFWNFFFGKGGGPTYSKRVLS